MGVIPVRSLERRALPQGAFDIDCLGWIEKRIDIHLHREEHAPGWLVDNSKDCLAADDDDLSLARHI